MTPSKSIFTVVVTIPHIFRACCKQTHLPSLWEVRGKCWTAMETGHKDKSQNPYQSVGRDDLLVPLPHIHSWTVSFPKNSKAHLENGISSMAFSGKSFMKSHCVPTPLQGNFKPVNRLQPNLRGLTPSKIILHSSPFGSSTAETSRLLPPDKENSAAVYSCTQPGSTNILMHISTQAGTNVHF